MTPIVIHVKHSFEIAPATLAFLETALVATKRELLDHLTRIEELVRSETDQGAAKDKEIAELRAKLADSLSGEELAAFSDRLTALEGSVTKIVPDEAAGGGPGPGGETPPGEPGSGIGETVPGEGAGDETP